VAGQSAFSLCPVCLERIPAAYMTEGDTVYLTKECDRHGGFRTAVWKGAPSMAAWCANSEESGDDPACLVQSDLCDDHPGKTCCAILNVTEQCNLTCNYCFEGNLSGDEPSLDHIKSSLRDVASKGITFVHLSGGEPTVRDDVPEIAAYAVGLGFEYVQLNTNGLRLAKDGSYARELADAGISTVFLQFDGTNDEVFSTLRGTPLFSKKCLAIENCGRAFLGVVLVPTIVPGVNDREIGNIVRFGIGHVPFVKGVHFQPVTYVGRFPAGPDNLPRITLPEILVAMEEQTNGQVRAEQFSPSSCDHPMCGFHAEFVRVGDGLDPLFRNRSAERCCGSKPPMSRAEAVRKSQNFVRFRWTRTRTDDSSAAASSIDAFLDNVQTNGFSISGMAFQDEFNVEMARLKRCSVHSYDGGKLIPFCARNIYHRHHASVMALNQ
jgi:7,8-dihydro-6-hydroxymethylpterin dimethyltransferase